ncbi:hypothetical protein [Haladaptatus sp. R4]|uniref:hypothetical protein n=1 Tax=Haladaptatus sp. R4 TaxID=1679489 RepID=UPI001680BAEB|nr:hypothetical protein [Haladaptatus sp. R4]
MALGTITTGLAGCTGVLSGEESNEGNGKWGLPSCENSERPIDVRGATIVDSNYVGSRDAYNTKARVVVEVLGAKEQVVRVKSLTILDKDGNEAGKVGKSDNLQLKPGSTKSFEFESLIGKQPAEVGSVVIQALPVGEWDASSLSEWQSVENKGCS